MPSDPSLDREAWKGDRPGASSSAVNSGFAERLLEVIDAGRRTATYKLAVLLALIDLCARGADKDGAAPEILYTQGRKG